jgi:hypothetical protein
MKTSALFTNSVLVNQAPVCRQSQQGRPAVQPLAPRRGDHVRLAVLIHSPAFLSGVSTDVGSSVSPYNTCVKPTAGVEWLLNARDGRAPAAAYTDR